MKKQINYNKLSTFFCLLWLITIISFFVSVFTIDKPILVLQQLNFFIVLLGIVSFLLFIIFEILGSKTRPKKRTTISLKEIKKSTPFFRDVLAKNKILIIILVAFLIIILVPNIPVPFRYKITGTNKGIIYKTDRFTGKTWVITPSGEKEITKFKLPSPKPAPQKFPTQYLEIKSIKSEKNIYGVNIVKVVIENNYHKDAKNIEFKVILRNTKDGPIFDTIYHTDNEGVKAGDILTKSIYLKKSDRQYWFEVTITSATY